ncbi:pyridoxal 5'-phosphate synthase [Aquimarina sp. MMG016]|uniref:pyridoxine/pyridoxamine 5'-phosphate oxidase n=1 Tax=Aquimarina sp. MMG016 TaxID=2822690 RepID=UPI001B3A6A13|nr:pyridoxal 5'-phosphate synthase [Aquimarina sp. MMG016]MBQ4819134.1 pyridoxal 5'-phosphate synthase [Aquimarina sp. MMG016]
MNPIEQFNNWYEEEIKKSNLRIPSACCLTSIGFDEYPNSRFVSLKEVVDHKFVITGPLNSRKGAELFHNPKSSLTFWWTETERQVRIQGDAYPIEESLANTYFESRNRDSKIVSHICNQGESIESLDILVESFAAKKSKLENTEIKRPENWGGFYLNPKRIEFMEFKKNRLHFRELFTKENNIWVNTFLQP